jgi:DNA polymerase III alpha subunit
MPCFGTELTYDGNRVVLWARTRIGLSRIFRLLTRRAEGPFDPRRAILEELEVQPGILTQSSCPDILVASDDSPLLAAARSRVYALLTPQNRSRWKALRGSGTPALASGEIRFLSKEDRKVQRLLIAIGSLKTVQEVRETELSPPGAVLLNPETAAADYTEVPEALAANEALAESIECSTLFEGFIFPRYESGPQGSAEVLRRLVYEGAALRNGRSDGKIAERIEYELNIIEQKGFSDYFLTVRDIARKASRICGRGSAAASIVSYCLGITDVEPLGHGLYFERFLNPGRKDHRILMLISHGMNGTTYLPPL